MNAQYRAWRGFSRYDLLAIHTLYGTFDEIEIHWPEPKIMYYTNNSRVILDHESKFPSNVTRWYWYGDVRDYYPNDGSPQLGFLAGGQKSTVGLAIDYTDVYGDLKTHRLYRDYDVFSPYRPIICYGNLNTPLLEDYGVSVEKGLTLNFYSYIDKDYLPKVSHPEWKINQQLASEGNTYNGVYVESIKGSLIKLKILEDSPTPFFLSFSVMANQGRVSMTVPVWS